MTPLEIIKDAYDRAGVAYVAREHNGYFYLVKCAEHTRENYRTEPLHDFLMRGFMEFYSDGSIASY